MPKRPKYVAGQRVRVESEPDGVSPPVQLQPVNNRLNNMSTRTPIPLPGRTVNEHALRALVDLPAREQRRQLELMLGTAARRPRASAGSNSRGRQDQLANSQKTAQVRAKRQIQRGLTSINGWISVGGHSLGFDRNF